MIGEIVENRRCMSYTFHTKTLLLLLLLWPHARVKKGYTSVLFVRSSVNSRLTFTQKSRSLSLVKFVPSSSSRRSCCSRAIEARKTKREPPPRARARSLRNGIIRKDAQFGTTTTTSPTTTFSLCVAEDVDDDVVFYRHQQEE